MTVLILVAREFDPIFVLLIFRIPFVNFNSFKGDELGLRCPLCFAVVQLLIFALKEEVSFNHLLREDTLTILLKD